MTIGGRNEMSEENLPSFSDQEDYEENLSNEGRSIKTY